MEGHLCVKCLRETCPNAGYDTSIAKCDVYILPKPITNADRIRAMTDEQFVELFTHLCCPYSLGGKVECNVENKGCKA